MPNKDQKYSGKPTQGSRAELDKSEQRFRDIAEVASDWFWETDSDFRFTYISDRFYEVSAISSNEVIGKTRLEFISEHERKTNPEKWKIHEDDLLNRRPFHNLDYQVQTSDGQPCFIRISGKPFFSEDGIFLGYRGAGSDITAQKVAEKTLKDAKKSLENLVNLRTSKLKQEIVQHKRTEAALQESEQKYLSLLEANPDPVVVYDMEGKVNYLNPAFTRVFGWSLRERIGQKMDDFVPEENWPETKMMIKRVTESEQRFSGLETCRYTKAGNIIPVSISGSFYVDQEGNTAGSVINIRDISERKRLEAQIQQTQKMEAIGTLAGGIAHDFNNILSAIMGFTEISLGQVEKGTDLYSNLQEVFRAGKRAKDLVKHILTFSRQAEQERKPVQIQLISKEALRFLRATLPTTIKIRTEIKSDSLVMADPTHIHQLLLNLCTNAGHAMGQKGGVLEVKLVDVEFEEDVMAENPELKPGPYLELTISDTGHGMTPQVLDRIFDPFFTTKEKGEGTGMGLSVVHGIVGSHGGKIKVSSEPGKGSTFKIYLPTVARNEPSLPIAEETIATGTERILFVDDETALVNIGKQMLGSLGYKVTARTSSIEALELFKAKADSFDLVITDMTMPNMTGDELAKELIRIKPEMPIILCTGYSARINQQQAATMGIRAFVSKPVLKRDIAETIRNVLDEK